MNIDLLSKLVKETHPKGLIRKIKSKYPNLLSEIINFQKEKQINTLSECIYLIINKLENKPVCPNLSINCIHTLRFISIKEGYSEYCPKCFMRSDHYRNQIKQTNIQRYGVDNPMKSEKFIQKSKKTVREKYGVDSTNQLDIVKQKKRKTLLLNYGSEGMASKHITNKKIQTNLKKKGVEWSVQTKEVQQKRINTCINRYGVDNVMKLLTTKEKIRKKFHNNEFFNYVSKLIISRGYELVSDYNHSHDNITLKCNKCNNTFNILWNSFQQGGGICPICYPKNHGFSFQEKEIGNFIKSLNLNIVENDRILIKPLELDIVIPEKKLAIEYCGLWCHSSGGNVPYLLSKDYHLHKLNCTNDKNYQLITIFEDEWIKHSEIIKSKLSYFLGKTMDMKKIRASTCFVRIIDYKTKSEFLNKYHLQGDKISQINLGLFDEFDLVSVMTFSEKTNRIFELDRFCNRTNTIVYGAASKLLQFFKKNYLWDIIISYADRRWSNGNVYFKLGFELNKITEPNYWYWGKEIKGRKHRLNFRKNQLVNMKSYDSSLTEFQIMSLENYAWIYDCGNFKFIMKNIGIT